jgi:uncharacterized phage protein (TIGR02218 family)
VTGTLWASETISHSKIPDSDQSFRSEIKVTLPIENDFAFDQLNLVSNNPLRLTIWKGFLNDPDGELVVQFVGRVLEASVDDSNSSVVFSCMTELASLQRKGLSQVIQRPCRHVHYGRGCNLDITEYQTAGQLLSISADGRTLTVAEAALEEDGFYSLGVIEWNTRFEMILTHVGTSLTLASPIQELIPTLQVKIAPGCPLSRNICNDRFSNILNFGGFPFISDNPFDGRQVF